MKKFLVLTSIGALVVGTWVYWSPRAAARQLRDAAETGDVEQLQRLVDFPLVQEQPKAHLKVSLLRSTLDTTGSSGFGAALATGLGSTMIDGFVNQFASPSGISALVRYGSIDSCRTGWARASTAAFGTNAWIGSGFTPRRRRGSDRAVSATGQRGAAPFEPPLSHPRPRKRR